MKRLLFTLAALATAATVQASSFNWTVDGSTWQCLPGSDSTYFTGTAYLFDSAAVSQQQVIDAGAGFTSLGYLQTLSLNEGEAGGASSTFSWGEAGQTLNAYYATLFNDGEQDYVFISTIGSQDGTTSSAETLRIYNVAGPSANPAFEGMTYQGAGWYSVPEPTSGLLVLIGMAGLMLRRKRA